MTKQQKVFASLKKAQGLSFLSWLGIIASVLLVTAFTFPSYAKALLDKGQQQIRYDVYAGGIHALQADLNVQASGSERYSVDLTAKTYGLLGKMAPWKGKFESHGWQGNQFKPESHQATTTWRDEDEIKKYSYNKDGSFNSFIIDDNSKDLKPRKVGAKLTQDTSDVLTATLNTMRAITATGKCEGSEEVFDGKRRYKLIFKQKGEADLVASRWNAYSGKAIECTAEVKPVAGKWHEKPRGWMSIQEQGRERGTMPTIWFAKLKDGEAAVPVKVRVKTSYGTLFMHITKYESAGKQFSLK